jgi:hypothetical protein
MRFLDFPDWIGQLSLAIDLSWLGVFLIFLSLVHICLIVIVVIKKTFSPFIKAAICIALLELPTITILLLWIAGLPKA